jgi:phage-related minor tail protein
MSTLDSIEFKVETKELDDAITKIGTLQRAVGELGKARTGTTAIKADNVIAKDVEERVTKVTNVLERQQDILAFMASGFSKGQASVLAYGKTAGLAAEQIKILGGVLDTQRKLIGGDTFDKSNSALKALQNQYALLKDAARAYNDESSLTQKQLQGLGLDKERLLEKYKIEGKSLTSVKAALRELNTEYNKSAINVNAQIAANTKLAEASKKTAAGQEIATKAMAKADEMLARLDNRISQMSHKDPISATASNSLYTFEKNLKAAGVAADIAAVKVEEFRKKQQQVSSMALVEQEKKVAHLANALAPQVTDITVGLMTGQNPFTVFLQQGGQVRDMIGLSQVETARLGEVFKKTFTGMIDMVYGMGRALVAAMLTPIGLVITTLVVFGIALYNVVKMTTEYERSVHDLNKALIISGNQAGITSDSLVVMTKEVSKLDGVTFGKAAEAMVGLTKTGKLTSDEFIKAAESAVLLEKYAGVAIADTVKAYKELSKEPLKAVMKLNEETGLFTSSIISQIAELERLGQTEDAATLARKTYTEGTIANAHMIQDSLQGLSKAMDIAGTLAEKMWKKIKGGVMIDTNEEAVKGITAEITKLESSLTVKRPGGLDIRIANPEAEKILAKLKEQLAYNQHIVSSNKDRAAWEEKTAEDAGKTSKYESERLSAMTKQETIQRRLKDLDKNVQPTLDEAAAKGTEAFIKAVSDYEKVKQDIITGKSGPKKDKAPEALSSFDTFLGNESAQYQKQLGIQLKAQDDFISQQKQRLDNSLSAKEITQGEFIAREAQLVEQGEKTKLNLINQGTSQTVNNYDKSINALKANYLSWVETNKSSPLFDEKNKEELKTFREKVQDLSNTTDTYLENLQANSAKTEESAFTRLTKQASELQGAIIQARLEREKFNRTEDEYAQRQVRQLELQDKARYATPEQTVYMQAYNAEKERNLSLTKSLNEDLVKQQDSLDGALKVMAEEMSYGEVISEQAQEKLQLLILQNKEQKDFIKYVKEQTEVKSKAQAELAVVKLQKDNFKKLSDGIAGAVETGLFEGGDAGKKSLRKLLEAELRKPITVFIQAIVGGISGLFSGGAGASAMGGAGGSAGGIGGFLNAGSTLNSAWNAATGGFSSGYANFAHSAVGQQLGLSQAMGPATSTGATSTAMTGFGSQAGTALGYAGAGLAGIGVGSAIAGDKSLFGLSGSQSSAIGAVAGAIIGNMLLPAIGGQLGAFLGGVAGGVFNAAFGEGEQKFQDTRLVGGFGGTGFSGAQRTRWEKEGGWFSSGSSGEDVRGLGTAQQKALNTVTLGTKSVFDNLIKTSGEAQKSIESWSFAIDRQVNTEEQQKQLIIDMASSMGDYLIPNLKAFIKTGENLADTAVRMNDEFLLTSKLAELLGKNASTAFGSVGLASLGARDNLVDLMGGIQQMTSSTQGYYENFFSETERHQNDLKALTKRFKDLGVVIPESRDGFRKLVESQDLSTTAGRTLVSQLLGLQGAFAAVNAATVDTTDQLEAQKKAQEEFLNSGKSIYEWLQKLKTSALGLASPQEQVQTTRGSYLSSLSGARVGDKTSLGNLTGNAESYLQAAMDSSNTQQQYKAILAQVQSEVGVVPAVVSYQQQLVNTANAALGLAQQQNSLLFSIANSTAVLAGTTAPSLLTQTANGSTGIQSTAIVTSASATSGSAQSSDLVLAAIREEIVGLRYEIRAGVEAEVKSTNILTRVSRNGEEVQTLIGAVFNLPVSA